jgi:16S rRNA processing protein RimM
MSDSEAFITIARVQKVQGRHGEVLAELHTDFPELFDERRKLHAWWPNGQRRELELEEYWPHKGGMVFKFAGVDSIEAAEELLKAEIQIPAAERAKLEDGAVYVSELVGCRVVEVGPPEREVGVVAEVNFGAGTAPLLIVNGDGGKEFMIPFVEGYLKQLDTRGKRIEMQLPDGMLELDAPLKAPPKTAPKGQ